MFRIDKNQNGIIGDTTLDMARSDAIHEVMVEVRSLQELLRGCIDRRPRLRDMVWVDDRPRPQHLVDTRLYYVALVYGMDGTNLIEIEVGRDTDQTATVLRALIKTRDGVEVNIPYHYIRYDNRKRAKTVLGHVRAFIAYVADAAEQALDPEQYRAKCKREPVYDRGDPVFVPKPRPSHGK